MAYEDLGHGGHHHHHHGHHHGPGWGPWSWPTQISYPPIAISERIQCSKTRPHPAPPGLYFDQDNKTWCWPIGTVYRPMGATTDMIEWHGGGSTTTKRSVPNGRARADLAGEVQGHPVRNALVVAAASRFVLRTSVTKSLLIGAVIGYLTR